MRKWFGAAGVALLVTTAHGQQDADGSLAKLPPVIRDKALEALDLKLVDGPSARLRQVKMEGHIVCGLINAKTKGGTYTGFFHFAANVESKAVIFMSSGAAASTSKAEFNGVSDAMIRKLCALDA